MSALFSHPKLERWSNLRGRADRLTTEECVEMMALEAELKAVATQEELERWGKPIEWIHSTGTRFFTSPVEKKSR